MAAIRAAAPVSDGRFGCWRAGSRRAVGVLARVCGVSIRALVRRPALATTRAAARVSGRFGCWRAGSRRAVGVLARVCGVSIRALVRRPALATIRAVARVSDGRFGCWRAGSRRAVVHLAWVCGVSIRALVRRPALALLGGGSLNMRCDGRAVVACGWPIRLRRRGTRKLRGRRLRLSRARGRRGRGSPGDRALTDTGHQTRSRVAHPGGGLDVFLSRCDRRTAQGLPRGA